MLVSVLVIIVVSWALINQNSKQKSKFVKEHFFEITEDMEDGVVGRLSFRSADEYICRIYIGEKGLVWETNIEDEPYIVSYPEGTKVVAFDCDWGIFEKDGALISVLIDRQVYGDEEMLALEKSVETLKNDYRMLKEEYPNEMADFGYSEEAVFEVRGDCMKVNSTDRLCSEFEKTKTKLEY